MSNYSNNNRNYTKKYIGSGKKNDKFDIVYTRLYVDKFQDLLKTDAKSGRKYLDINVGSRREPDQYGYTHGIWVNVEEGGQQPQYQTQQTNYQQRSDEQISSFDISDAPF